MDRTSPIAVIVAVLILALMIGMPYERSGSVTSVFNFLVPFFTVVCIFAIVAIGLNVQWGYTGVLNFGVVGFFMVGAYTAAIFTKQPADSDFVQYVGGFGDHLAFFPILDSEQWLPALIGILAAGGFAALLALLLAFPLLRLREDHLAIVTIGVAEVLRRIVIEERGLVNGTRGLPGIPRPFSGWVDPSEYRYVIFLAVLAVLLITFVAVEAAARSPWGRVLRAIREDEGAAAAVGKSVLWFKLQSFVFGAAVMGMAGALYAYQQGAISPDAFTHFFGTFLIWTMLIVGGSGNNLGAILGAFIVWGLWSITLQLSAYNIPEFLRVRIFYFRDFAIGLLIVTVLLLQPRGLLPERRRVSRWLERRVARLRRAEAQQARREEAAAPREPAPP
jgi:branched-chain amino acid transport system permease protein